MSRSERRRETRSAGGSAMNKLYIVLVLVAVVGIAAVGYSVGTARGGAATEPVAVEGVDDLNRLVELAQGVMLGEESAPVTIIEFGDYQCPGCAAFAQQVKPQLDLGLVQPGRVKFVYYDFPIMSIHPNAFLAARAARCAGDQDKYWEYHDNLYRQQPRWSVITNPLSTFVDYAETLGLDRRAFESCLDSDRHADVVTANMELGEQLGVRGTPSIMLEHGGSPRWLANFDFQTIQRMVTEALGEAEG